jgi:hypothetical protein
MLHFKLRVLLSRVAGISGQNHSRFDHSRNRVSGVEWRIKLKKAGYEHSKDFFGQLSMRKSDNGIFFPAMCSCIF